MQKIRLFTKSRFYIKRIRWLWNHRDEMDCNSKFRRMEYDIKYNHYRKGK